MIKPGIYFGLDEDTYHRDASLGSTDMKGLARNPVSWWHYSRFNPRREEEETTPALIFGKAVHAMTLEGRSALDTRFWPTEHSGSTREGKLERKSIIDSGRQPIRRADYERALIAGTHIRADPEYGKAFQNGMPEVSVFWERDGIRRKARLDFLKVASTVDLKSAREQEKYEFEVFCNRQIAEMRYYMQGVHYQEARAQMAPLLAQGRLYFEDGVEPPNMDWLSAVVAQEDPAFSWVFYASSGPPETYGTYMVRAHQMYGTGESLIRLAEHNWRTYSEQFGLEGTPWVKFRKMQAFSEDEIPAYLW